MQQCTTQQKKKTARQLNSRSPPKSNFANHPKKVQNGSQMRLSSHPKKYTPQLLTPLPPLYFMYIDIAFFLLLVFFSSFLSRSRCICCRKSFVLSSPVSLFLSVFPFLVFSFYVYRSLLPLPVMYHYTFHLQIKIIKKSCLSANWIFNLAWRRLVYLYSSELHILRIQAVRRGDAIFSWNRFCLQRNSPLVQPTFTHLLYPLA